MPRLDDYDCACGASFEHLRMQDTESVACPRCGGSSVSTRVGSKLIDTIVPMHRRSLRQKAGFVHTHGDRPAEKRSVAIPANKGNF